MFLVLTIIKLILVLSVVAIIHEFGHFIFAKWQGMKVNEFSIGFGKALWQKEKNGTMYSFRLILLGGYVALDGEENESDNPNAFYKYAPWRRIVVLVAGVTFNAILAIMVFLGVNLSYDTNTTIVNSIEPTSISAQAGIQVGDEITRIDGKRVHIFHDIYLYTKLSNKDVQVEYLRDGNLYTTTVKNAVKTKGYVGVYFDSSKMDEEQQILSYIEMVEPGMPGAKAGLKAGDKIIKVGDILTATSKDVIEQIAQSGDKQVNVTVLRNDNEVELSVTPITQEYFDLEIYDTKIIKSNIATAWYKSLNTIENVVASYGNLFTGKVKINQLSGVVGMGEMVSQATNVVELLSFLALISLAVGVANIMPFPPLDGGKILLVIIEWITKKRVPPKVENILSIVGFALLILLAIYVTINDIIRVV